MNRFTRIWSRSDSAHYRRSLALQQTSCFGTLFNCNERRNSSNSKSNWQAASVCGWISSPLCCISSDFIRFHQISPDFIRCYPSKIWDELDELRSTTPPVLNGSSRTTKFLVARLTAWVANKFYNPKNDQKIKQSHNERFSFSRMPSSLRIWKPRGNRFKQNSNRSNGF